MTCYKPFFNLKRTEEKLVYEFLDIFKVPDQEHEKIAEYMKRKVTEREKQKEYERKIMNGEETDTMEEGGNEADDEEDEKLGNFIEIEDEQQEHKDEKELFFSCTEEPEQKDEDDIMKIDKQKRPSDETKEDKPEKQSRQRPSVKRQSRKGRLSKNPDLEYEKKVKMDMEVDEIMERLEE